MSDFIILAVISISVVLIIRNYVKKRKSGESGCGCGCSGCNSNSCGSNKDK